MTLLIKMQKTLVSFSFTLMLKVRLLFMFLRRWIKSNLFELIHLNKNMKRNKISKVLGFQSSLSVCTKEYCKYNMCVLKIVLIFINILLCKPTLKSVFLDSGCGILATIYFLKIISFTLLLMSWGYSTCSKLFFLF